MTPVLYFMIGFDHDIVDGAPTARYAHHFTNLIERDYGLEARPADR